MKKLIILAVVGLVAGIGGGTGIAIVMKPDVVADSTVADSTATPRDTTAVVPAAPERVDLADRLIQPPAEVQEAETALLARMDGDATDTLPAP